MSGKELGSDIFKQITKPHQNLGNYKLFLNSDGIGTKVKIAEYLQKYDTLAYDLMAMLLDDVIRTGATALGVNTVIDCNYMDANLALVLSDSLKKVCNENNVSILGGEIAELGDRINGRIEWSGTIMSALLHNSAMLNPKENIKAGNFVYILKETGLRSNGFTKAQFLLKESYGKNWFSKISNRRITYGEELLEPSKIYYKDLLKKLRNSIEDDFISDWDLILFNPYDIVGLCHVTGGGVYKIFRYLPEGLGVRFLRKLPIPEIMLELKALGKMSSEEMMKTWNCGAGMLVITSKETDVFGNLYGIITETGMLETI